MKTLDFYKDKERKSISVDDVLGLAVANKLMGHDEIDWDSIVTNYILNDQFIWTYKDNIDMNKIFYHQLPSNEMVDKLIQHFGIGFCCEAINYNKKLIDPQLVAMSIELEEWLIDKYKDKWDWTYIWTYQIMSEELIEKYINYADWELICCNQKLSMPFIRKNKDKVDWLQIYLHQELNEEFIEEMENKTYWDAITSHQKYLSEEFIEKHSNEINFNWKNIKLFQKNVSKEFIEKHLNDIMRSKKLKDGYKKQRSA